jgi:hypothetical protein
MRKASLISRRGEILQRQRAERTKLEKDHEARNVRETLERQARLRKGLFGFWDRLTGKHSKVRKQNEYEAIQSRQRDRAERERLIFRQLDLRRTLDQEIKRTRQEHAERTAELHRDIASYKEFGKEQPATKERPQEREAATDRAKTRERPRRRSRNQEPKLER